MLIDNFLHRSCLNTRSVFLGNFPLFHKSKALLGIAIKMPRKYYLLHEKGNSLLPNFHIWL